MNRKEQTNEKGETKWKESKLENKQKLNKKIVNKIEKELRRNSK